MVNDKLDNISVSGCLIASGNDNVVQFSPESVVLYISYMYFVVVPVFFFSSILFAASGLLNKYIVPGFASSRIILAGGLYEESVNTNVSPIFGFITPST